MNYVFCGLEISAGTIEVCLGKTGADPTHRAFPNTRAGQRRLLAWITRESRPVRACMEATGVYGLDLALLLSSAPGIELMVANPRAARRFAEALMRRAKTDRVDAKVLRTFAERMPFEPWQPPTAESLALRAMTRRLQALTEQSTAEKNRLHAAEASRSCPASVRRSLKRQIQGLARECERLSAEILAHIRADESLRSRYRLLLTVKGIGPKSASQLLGELAALPADLTAKQWVAHAGLDPKPHESGHSVGKPRRISKTGNTRLRRAIYMPALVAMQWSPHCQAFCQRLQDRGLRPIQAVVALMRKLLHAIHGMWSHNRAFNPEKLFPNIIASA